MYSLPSPQKKDIDNVNKIIQAYTSWEKQFCENCIIICTRITSRGLLFTHPGLNNTTTESFSVTVTVTLRVKVGPIFLVIFGYTECCFCY